MRAGGACPLKSGAQHSQGQRGRREMLCSSCTVAAQGTLPPLLAALDQLQFLCASWLCVPLGGLAFPLMFSRAGSVHVCIMQPGSAPGSCAPCPAHC